MEHETLQIARVFKYPQWTSHYEEFLQEMKEGLHQPANRILLSLCQKIAPDYREATPDALLDSCLENSLTWSSEEEESRGARVPRGNLLQRSNKIRELLQKEEDPGQAEKNFRNWLQRTIACNATMVEPGFLSNGMLRDPFQEASEKLAILQSRSLYFGSKNDEIFFPLEDTSFVFLPKVPLGLDIFDQEEWGGGPEFDSVITLAGESNVGKTMLGLFLMSCLASCRKNVLVVSGEDSPQENKKRLFCHFLKLLPPEIAQMSDKERLLRMNKLYGEAEDQESLHHHLRTRFASVCPDEGKLTPSYIRERIDETENRMGEPIHAVMIDYLQKTKPDGKTNRMQRDEELEIFVNQVKEQGENKHLSLLISQVPSHAAGGATEFLGIKQATARSYAATWGAHHIVTMNRIQEETERLRGSDDKRVKINLFLCKNKNGPIGTCHAIGYPRESRWRFFRTKSEMQRAFETTAPRLPRGLEEKISA